jgi:hypothetical protein
VLIWAPFGNGVLLALARVEAGALPHRRAGCGGAIMSPIQNTMAMIPGKTIPKKLCGFVVCGLWKVSRMKAKHACKHALIEKMPSVLLGLCLHIREALQEANHDKANSKFEKFKFKI